jgi:uncharacterized protein
MLTPSEIELLLQVEKELDDYLAQSPQLKATLHKFLNKQNESTSRLGKGVFEIKKTQSGKFFFNLKAGNGQVILTSQQYEDMNGVINGIESVRMSSQIDERFDRRVASDGSPFFALVAGNNLIIGKSEMYSSESGMENGIKSVKNNASNAGIDDRILIERFQDFLNSVKDNAPNAVVDDRTYSLINL